MQNGDRIWIQHEKMVENGYLDVFFRVWIPENGQPEVYDVIGCTGGAVDWGEDTWRLVSGRHMRRGPRSGAGRREQVAWQAGWRDGTHTGRHVASRGWLPALAPPNGRAKRRGPVGRAPPSHGLGHERRPE